ncbi:SDR family oxidoreductase [Paenibacillus anaericanus]|uniref:SDR family oxidoreductase n=1 Tax=Paenibacillus anaericanus TaxID=170367 RepID=A0A3S1K3I6_9BACL|nr:SDR family oxidoreductase [Paenibacillus anaericanus]RUT42996.1 SDR family oxidoreductase [Paenibacillus anaericanus]
MQDPFSLSDKTILLTGASSGIGKQIAETLSKQGARLILVGRHQDTLDETKGYLNVNLNQNHIVENFDLEHVDEIPGWMKEIVSKHNVNIDGIVHSAGIQTTSPIRTMKISEIEKMMSLNLYSGLALLKGLSNKKVNSSGGSFVFISSIMGVVGQPGIVGYSASKGAINSAVKSSALELARHGIRVNSICPGFIPTKMMDQWSKLVTLEKRKETENQYPLGFGTPTDVAYAAVYLLSEAARWVTGTSMVIDGGYSCQ